MKQYICNFKVHMCNNRFEYYVITGDYTSMKDIEKKITQYGQSVEIIHLTIV